MKKILLMLAMLLPCVGAWAQTPVVTIDEIGEAPYQVSDADAEKIFSLDNLTVVLDVTTAATMTDRGAFFCVADPAQPIANFAGTNTSYMACGHNGTGTAYIAAAKGGQHFSVAGIPTSSTIKLAYVFDKTNNLFKAYIGDTNTEWTMNRNFGGYEIATPKMVKEDFANANIYIGGGMANNATHELADATIHKVRVFDGTLTIDEIKNLDVTPDAPKYVTEISDFENGKLYTFVTERGWMGAKADNDNVISSALAANGVTGSKEDANFQWTVYKSANNNYYLYNIGKQMFMGTQSANNSAIPFVATPSTKALTFKKSNSATHPIMFSTNNSGVVNHSTDRTPGLINWADGWNNLNDAGSNHQVEIIGDLDVAVLTKIENAITAFELDNTEAVTALDAAIAKAETLFTQITIGDKVGQYTSTDANYATNFAAIKAFRETIVSTNTPTPAEVEAKTAEVNAIIASFQLNLPEVGFYRIMAVADWNNDARYLGAQNSTAKSGRAEYIAEANANTIFYFDGTQLLSYGSGNYLVSNSNFLGYNGIQATGSKVAFHAASNNLIGAYNISFNDGGRWLYCNQNNYTDAGGRGTQHGYCFNLEEVTELPVAISAAAHATFYAPVAVQVSDIEAYTVSVNGDWATLTVVEGGVIPANTGVVLKGAEGTYNFTIASTDATLETALRGTAATTMVAESAYVLSAPEGVVGLYLANANPFQNNAFKAYLPATAVTSNAQALRFTFGGTTAIESVINNDANAPIFDLSGRRVNNAVKGGIYIQNGKKFIVK